ncbi:hypothetical protein D3C71_1199380 [compost metagenome]
MPGHRRLRTQRILQAGGVWQTQFFALIQADGRRQHRQQRQKGISRTQITLAPMANDSRLIRITGAPQAVCQSGAASIQHLNQFLYAEGHDLQRQWATKVLLRRGGATNVMRPVAIPQRQTLRDDRRPLLLRQWLRQDQAVYRQLVQVGQRRNHAVSITHDIPVSITETDRVDPVQGWLSDGRHWRHKSGSLLHVAIKSMWPIVR